MILRIVCAVLALAFLVLVGWLLTPADAHLKGCEGECQNWMMSLTNKNGTLCCDFNEAKDLGDAEWDTTIINGVSHYRVFVEGQWLVVDTDSVVVPEINRLGPALAWIIHLDGRPWVKCFLRGAGA